MRKVTCTVLQIQLVLAVLLFALAVWQADRHPQKLAFWQQYYTQYFWSDVSAAAEPASAAASAERGTANG